MSNRRVMFAEERAPCGETGLIWRGSGAPFDRRCDVDLSDCQVSRPRSHILVIWEPLATKAPKPPKCRAHCCYLNTVIFYVSPHVVRPWSRLWRGWAGGLRRGSPGFEQWDEIKTRLIWDDVVSFDYELFTIQGGYARYSAGRWWMVRHARRSAARLEVA